MTMTDTFVLVHGSWHGGWAWEPTAWCLRELGHTVACDWEVFRDQFMQDARPRDARSVWERLVPQPFQPWAAKLDLTEFCRSGLPKSYIAVADDRALPEGTWRPGMSSRIAQVRGQHLDHLQRHLDRNAQPDPVGHQPEQRGAAHHHVVLVVPAHQPR
jgi:hypothetical protein